MVIIIMILVAVSPTSRPVVIILVTRRQHVILGVLAVRRRIVAHVHTLDLERQDRRAETHLGSHGELDLLVVEPVEHERAAVIGRHGELAERRQQRQVVRGIHHGGDVEREGGLQLVAGQRVRRHGFAVLLVTAALVRLHRNAGRLLAHRLAPDAANVVHARREQGVHHGRTAKTKTHKQRNYGHHFSSVRSARFRVGGYYTKWQIQGGSFHSSSSRSLNVKTSPRNSRWNGDEGAWESMRTLIDSHALSSPIQRSFSLDTSWNINCAQGKRGSHSKQNSLSTSTEFTWPWRRTLANVSDVKYAFPRCRNLVHWIIVCGETLSTKVLVPTLTQACTCWSSSTIFPWQPVGEEDRQKQSPGIHCCRSSSRPPVLHVAQIEWA